MDNNQWEEQSDITRFLEKFNKEPKTEEFNFSRAEKGVERSSLFDENYNKSFEKLEEKIQELEEKFAASTAQNQAVMQELARTRQAVENQKSKDEFFANIATTIASLKQSVENLSRAQEAKSLYEGPSFTRAFDAPAEPYQPDTYRAMQQAKLQLAEEAKQKAVSDLNAARQEKEQAQLDLYTARAEKEQALSALRREQEVNAQVRMDSEENARLLSSLQQKASQLKAVNVALDREIKRAQQERTEALRKSAEQAKEILSLRDALTAAEERFKSFDFEGRIISIKRQYEQKVNTLETQLHEISTTCMKQVEEIESLKTENLRLQQVAEEREQLAALYEAKTRELEQLRASVSQMHQRENQEQLANIMRRMEHLQTEHEALAQRLTKAQEALQTVNSEKQTLEDNFKALLGKIAKNDEVILSLRQKIAVLTEENLELKQGKTPAKITLRRPQAPHAPTATAARAASAAKTQVPQPPVAPVEMENTMHSPLKTDADLPEIRVAEPMPQEELYNGEDFLEKTDSFIGRMKWSIFREDK